MNARSETSEAERGGDALGLDVHQQNRVSVVVRAKPRMETVVTVMVVAMMPVMMAMTVPAMPAAMAMAAMPMHLRHTGIILYSER